MKSRIRKNGNRVLLAAAVVATVFIGSGADAEVVYVGSEQGTHGNDTASSLYLRPINQSISGTSYFGAGYPRQSLGGYFIQSDEKSGTVKAMEYLQTSGWNQWNAERQALLGRIAELERRLAELEKKIAEGNKQ